MQKHTKIYLDAFGLDVSDWRECERCLNTGVDTCHIEPRGMGGSKELDRIENLMAMCRDCHVYTEGQPTMKAGLFKIHRRKMEREGVKFDANWINRMIDKYSLDESTR